MNSLVLFSANSTDKKIRVRAEMQIEWEALS